MADTIFFFMVQEEDSSIQAGLVCTGEQDSCLVHSTVLPRVHWTFYNRTEELDSLLNNLNQRGLREGELRLALVNSRARLDASMGKCPAHLLGRPEVSIYIILSCIEYVIFQC